MLRLILILAFLQSTQDAEKEALRAERLSLMAEYADARADRARVERTLQKIGTAGYNAADDETLRQLTNQLTEAERKVAEMQREHSGDPGASDLVGALKLRDALNKKVQTARDNLPRFYEAELAEAKDREQRLLGAVFEIQKKIEPGDASLQADIAAMQKRLQADDDTLRQLTAQLTKAESTVAEMQRKHSGDPEASELVEAVRLRDDLNKKVQAARDNLPLFLQTELAEAKDSERRLFDAVSEIQKKIEPGDAVAALEKQLQDVLEQLAKAQKEGQSARVVELQKTVDAIRNLIDSTKLDSHPNPGEVKVNQRDEMSYAYVPGGTFQMGCVPADRNCRADEKPSHSVTLTHGFWMATTEVTVKTYRLFVAATGRALPKQHTSTNPVWKVSGQPMSFVSWDDANAYCKWAGGRLPTEAEWEYAARGGRDSLVYPWGDTPSHDEANYLGKGGRDQYDEVADAGSFNKNIWALYDLIGNVGEWVDDYYAPYAKEPSTDPTGPKDGKLHVVRGGSWSSTATGIRSSAREAWKPGNYSSIVGFRCVVDKLQ